MAGLATKQAKIGYDSAVNAAIMQAAQTYTSLKRAHAQFKIALEGEYKMKKQTGMQDYRIQRGAAVGTDVLQAKRMLLLARSRVELLRKVRWKLQKFHSGLNSGLFPRT